MAPLNDAQIKEQLFQAWQALKPIFSEMVSAEPGTGPNPTPIPEPTPNPSASKPTDLIPAMKTWTVMLPTGSQGDPDNLYAVKAEVEGKQWFYVNQEKTGVTFRVRADGFHSPNSQYPRTELREMKDEKWTKAAWNAKTGTHTMELVQSINHIPVVKPHLCAAQIHDGSDDILQIRIEGTRLMAVHTDGAIKLTLDDNYVLGTKYKVKIVASGGKITVTYNDTKTVSLNKSGSGWFFKAGAYLQSNVSKGDKPDAYGEVSIYSLKVTHS